MSESKNAFKEWMHRNAGFLMFPFADEDLEEAFMAGAAWSRSQALEMAAKLWDTQRPDDPSNDFARDLRALKEQT